MAGKTLQITVNDIRKNNTLNIFEDIVKSGGITKTELGRRNGISNMTVKNIIDVLRANGLVEEHLSDSSYGRKPMVVSVSSDYGNIVCMNLSSVNEIIIVVYDLTGQIISKDKLIFSSENRDLSHNITQAILSAKNRLAEIHTDTVGVALFVPGIYDEKEDIVRYSLQKEYNSLKLKGLFKQYFDTDNIFPIHDTFALAKSECEDHPESMLTQFYLYCGDGVGGCLISDGQVYDGTNGWAGEVGNVLVKSIDNIDKSISLEEACSIRTISARFEKIGSFDDILNAYEAGKKEVKKYLDFAIDEIARFLYNMVWIYDPERIVIDSYNKKYKDLILARTKKFFDENFPQEYNREIAIDIGKNSEYYDMKGCMQEALKEWMESIL